MFDGNKECNICGKDLPEKERNFGVSLSGYTYVFCTGCLEIKKGEITDMLQTK